MPLQPGRLTRIPLIEISTELRKDQERVKHGKIDAFNLQIQNDREILNQDIDLYNQERSSAKKESILKRLFEHIKRMDHKYPDWILQLSNSYRATIQTQLFSELKTESARLNHHAPHEDTASISSILANLSPNALAALSQCLISASSDNDLTLNAGLKAIYKTTDKEYPAFTAFLENNAIAFLGGNNSKNFKITSRSGEVVVLKLENRLGMPKAATDSLRSSEVQDSILPTYAERQVTFRKNGKLLTRTLLVTDFCTGGDLMALSKKPNKMASASDIYRQMGTILMALEGADHAFIDMKNSNWALDDNGKLRIHDNKGVIPTDENTLYKLGSGEYYWYDFPTTEWMNPPEINAVGAQQSAQFDANKVHAYMLGKNIYQYLTGCKAEYLLNRHKGELYDFRSNLFVSLQGLAFKALIQDLIRETPSERISIREACERLKQIEIIGLQEECGILVNKLSNFGGELETAAAAAHEHIMSLQETAPLLELKNTLSTQLNTETLKKGCQDTFQLIQSQNKTYTNEGFSAMSPQSTEDELVALKAELQRVFTQNNEDILRLREACRSCLSRVTSQSFGKSDTMMAEYVRLKTTEINDTQDINQLKSLGQALVALRTDPIIASIRGTIQSFRSNAMFYNGKQSKADLIERAMCSVPIELRASIMDMEHVEPSVVTAREALASHRDFYRQRVYKKEGALDEDKAADSFTRLKAQFHALKAQAVKVSSTEEERVDTKPRPRG